jgi:hypothetical protein
VEISPKIILPHGWKKVSMQNRNPMKKQTSLGKAFEELLLIFGSRHRNVINSSPLFPYTKNGLLKPGVDSTLVHSHSLWELVVLRNQDIKSCVKKSNKSKT